MSHRTPIGKARVTGTDLRNPARFARRNSPELCPVGEPPEVLDDAQREAWHSFSSEVPWLNRSHRAILHLASILRAKVEGGIEGINHLQVYSSVLSKLAATPVDESRVMAREEEDDTNEFFDS